MDKYEYNLKLDQIKTLLADEKNKEAAEVADSINWNKIKNVNALVRAGEVYEKVGRYEECRELLLSAYERAPIGRTIIYRLAEVAIKMKDFEGAKEYYEEFIDIAPYDNQKYILEYNIKKAEGVSAIELIPILEELKEEEYTEEWAYELAKLYDAAGMKDKCIDACDELILWFGDGPYVENALELKKLYQPLTKAQEEKYALFCQKKESKIVIDTEKPKKSEKEVVSSVTIPQAPLNSKFNPINFKDKIVKGMQQIVKATEKGVENREEVSCLDLQMEESIQEDVVGQINFNEKRDDSLKRNVQELLSEESDGQISFMMNEKALLEKQITGQMHIADILAEWEKTKCEAEAVLREVEQEKLESAKIKAIQEAEDIMIRLQDIIPKIKAAEINQTGKLIEDVNVLLDQEIEKINTENAQIDNTIQEISAQDIAIQERALLLGQTTIQMSDTQLYEDSLYGYYEIGEANSYDKIEEYVFEDEALSEIEVLVFEDKVLPKIEVPVFEEEALPEIGVPTLEEEALAEIEVPTLEDEVLPEIEMPVFEDEVLPKIEVPTLEEEALAEIEVPTLEEEALAEIEVPILEDETLAEIEVPTLEDEVLPKIEIPVFEAKVLSKVEKPIFLRNYSYPIVDQIKTSKIRLDEKPEDLAKEVLVEEPVPMVSLTEEQRAIFSYFMPVKGMEKQLCKALSGIVANLTGTPNASVGNLIIRGSQGCGKTVLATSIVKVLQKQCGKPNGRIGKIDAEALNKKDVKQLLQKVQGGCLIIERAGALSRTTAMTLSLLLEQDNTGILVILEDTAIGIKKALLIDDGFAKKFTESVTVPIFTHEDLIGFAKAYANERGYEIEQMAILALHNRISNIEKIDQATTLVEIKDIIDEAIEREAHGGIRKAFNILTAKRYTDDDKIVLTEKDFE